MKNSQHISLLDYQRDLVKCLISKYKIVHQKASTSRPVLGHSPLRLVDRHFPAMYPKRPVTNKPVQKRCIVCSSIKKRKETTYYCPSCNVPLCVLGCFEKYHTVKRFDLV